MAHIPTVQWRTLNNIAMPELDEDKSRDYINFNDYPSSDYLLFQAQVPRCDKFRHDIKTLSTALNEHSAPGPDELERRWYDQLAPVFTPHQNMGEKKNITHCESLRETLIRAPDDNFASNNISRHEKLELPGIADLSTPPYELNSEPERLEKLRQLPTFTNITGQPGVAPSQLNPAIPGEGLKDRNIIIMDCLEKLYAPMDAQQLHNQPNAMALSKFPNNINLGEVGVPPLSCNQRPTYQTPANLPTVYWERPVYNVDPPSHIALPQYIPPMDGPAPNLYQVCAVDPPQQSMFVGQHTSNNNTYTNAPIINNLKYDDQIKTPQIIQTPVRARDYHMPNKIFPALRH